MCHVQTKSKRQRIDGPADKSSSPRPHSASASTSGPLVDDVLREAAYVLHLTSRVKEEILAGRATAELTHG
jgi:hypothetical protein